MFWTSRQSGSVLVGEPNGLINEGNWEAFLAAMSGAIGEAAELQAALVVDLHQLSYMSSRGLRALSLAKREAESKGVPFSVARPNERMKEIFAISQYDKIVTVSETLEA